MKQNPRRAYNKDGTEIPPATVGGELTRGHCRAEIWCGECHHHAEVPIDDMPAELPIPDICLRYRCSRCGSKRLTSRMSMIEFYDVLYARTGMSHGNAITSRGVEPAGGSHHEDHDRD